MIRNVNEHALRSDWILQMLWSSFHFLFCLTTVWVRLCTALRLLEFWRRALSQTHVEFYGSIIVTLSINMLDLMKWAGWSPFVLTFTVVYIFFFHTTSNLNYNNSLHVNETGTDLASTNIIVKVLFCSLRLKYLYSGCHFTFLLLVAYNFSFYFYLYLNKIYRSHYIQSIQPTAGRSWPSVYQIYHLVFIVIFIPLLRYGFKFISWNINHFC